MSCYKEFLEPQLYAVCGNYVSLPLLVCPVAQLAAIRLLLSDGTSLHLAFLRHSLHSLSQCGDSSVAMVDLKAMKCTSPINTLLRFPLLVAKRSRKKMQEVSEPPSLCYSAVVPVGSVSFITVPPSTFVHGPLDHLYSLHLWLSSILQYKFAMHVRVWFWLQRLEFLCRWTFRGQYVCPGIALTLTTFEPIFIVCYGLCSTSRLVNLGCAIFFPFPLFCHAFALSLSRVINSNFRLQLPRNITSHTMKNLAFHSVLRLKDDYTTNSYHLAYTLFLNLGVKGLNCIYSMYDSHSIPWRCLRTS